MRVPEYTSSHLYEYNLGSNVCFKIKLNENMRTNTHRRDEMYNWENHL